MKVLGSSLIPRLAITAFLLGSALAARATVIYDNFGPGDSWNSGWPPGGLDTNIFFAIPFAVTHTSIFTQASFAFAAEVRWGPVTYTVSIHPDSAGIPSSTSLNSVAVIGTGY